MPTSWPGMLEMAEGRTKSLVGKERCMTTGLARKFALAFVLPFLAFTLVGCNPLGGDDGPKTPDATATPEPPDAEEVIAQWIADNRNVDYVGDCGDAQQGIDVGKLCSTLVATRGRMRAYHIGPTFSEYTVEMLLEQSDATGWSVLRADTRNPNQEVPGIDWPLQISDLVVFVGLGENDCLSIREQPSTQANRLICMADGTQAFVMEGPVEAEGYTWWRVAGEGFDGWAVSVYMRLPEAIQELFATPVPPEE